MATVAALMAIPSPLESIRLVGDEEKHATLLYFGETSTLPGEAQQTLKDSVATACEMLFPFSESIVDVSRLGSDVPPALVAKLSGENLAQVRNLFFMNPAVKSYLDNAEQHPGFIPHVTLGFPDFADEAILRSLMRDLFRVRFNRLSLWWNDERFDWDLNGGIADDWSMSDAVNKVMAEHALDDQGEDNLEHSGVKGMKWGVRRAVDSATGRVEQTGNTGLTPRIGSADSITQERIVKKIKTGGVASLSNADLQAYTRRLQMEKDVKAALAAQSAADKAKTDGFIKTFVKRQAGRQAGRVVDKALDIAVEKALHEAGIKIGKKGGNPNTADLLVKTSERLAPKKKGG